MLTLPSKGFSRSVNEHNVDLNICCDWLEASALYLNEEIAGSDIVDVLREKEIYEDQDFAWALVSDALNTMRNRALMMGASYPVTIEATRIRAKDSWEFFPAYSFCLALSIASSYAEWARAFGRDYTEQGALFEALTAESVAISFHGWTIHPTGWTRTRTQRLNSIVTEIAQRLGEATGDLLRWTRDTAKEAGLDLLFYRPFPDGRVGIPVYLCQCASGEGWERKLKAPDLRVWCKIIPFASDPKKAFAMPFTVSDSEFVRHSNSVDGLLLDRQRLLLPGLNNRNWVSADLSEGLINWTRPRTRTLPVIDNEL
jgi:hypothetical protein